MIGGFAGAAICAVTLESGSLAAGFAAVKGSVIIKIASFIILAPIIGMIMATILSIITLWAVRRANPYHANHWFKRLQLVSSALFSIGHGMNDSQKVMGIIGAALIAATNSNAIDLPAFMQMKNMGEMHDWIPLACFTVIGLGTMSGGWKIVKTMGSRITKVTPFEGVVAETAGALTLYLTEIVHIPVSTTHTITGSIIGVGATKRLSAVRWGLTVNLLWAWILTIPVSAALAALIYLAVKMF